MFNVPVIATTFLAVAVCGLAAGFVSGRADAHARYLVSIDRAEQEFYAARKLCVSLIGADWERCAVNALAERWRAVADTDAARRNTPESYRLQRLVATGTAFLLQTQRCGALAEPAGARACFGSRADRAGLCTRGVSRSSSTSKPYRKTTGSVNTSEGERHAFETR
jgi:hypothetical protein